MALLMLLHTAAAAAVQMMAAKDSMRVVAQAWPGHRSPSGWLVAEDVISGERLGCCGVEALPLVMNGGALLGEMQVSTADERSALEVRPLLSGLWVEERHRRCGVGGRLVQEAEALASSWGFDELLLQVCPSNVAAVGLYERFGWVQIYSSPVSTQGLLSELTGDKDGMGSATQSLGQPLSLGARLLDLIRGPTAICMRKELCTDPRTCT